MTLRSKFINMLIQKSDEHKERIMTELSSNKESIKVNSHILRKCGTSRQTDNQYAGNIVELNANKYQIHFMRNQKREGGMFVFSQKFRTQLQLITLVLP